MIAGVYVSAGLDEHGHCVGKPFLSGNVERRFASFVFGFDFRSRV